MQHFFGFSRPGMAKSESSGEILIWNDGHSYCPPDPTQKSEENVVSVAFSVSLDGWVDFGGWCPARLLHAGLMCNPGGDHNMIKDVGWEYEQGGGVL
jgi:hypothetical protein